MGVWPNVHYRPDRVGGLLQTRKFDFAEGV